MIADLNDLLKGYGDFRQNRWPYFQSLYQQLAEEGQRPATLLIGCSDSRVDPGTIFNAGPGELFVLRNVANVVPVYAPDGGLHGTSSAIEFAVTKLKVQQIVVLGHAQCGGIAALLSMAGGAGDDTDFIGQWMAQLEEARDRVLKENKDADPDQLQTAMEHAAIRQSMENLRTFPYVKERTEENTLSLRGAYFSVATGTLSVHDEDSGVFEPISASSP